MFNEPVEEISKLHTKEYKYENLSLEEANNKIKDLDSNMLHMKFEVENFNTMLYGLQIGDDRLGYSIRDNTFSYNDESFKNKYFPERASKTISYELIIDKTSIEVFVDKGRYTMVLPRKLGSKEKKLEFWLENGTDLQFKSLNIYEIKSIWE